MTQIIDLTYPIETGMLTFDAPWHPKVLVEQMGRINTVGRETRKITMGTHTGTQIDAPLHFINQGGSIDQVALNKLVGPVTIAAFSNLGENGEVTRELLEKVSVSERMLFRFGWGKHWPEKNFYQGYPFFTVEAAQYLVDKKVQLLGFDTPSPDDSRIRLRGDVLGSAADSPIHKIFLGAGIALVEYLANLDSVTDLEGWTIAALPLKIKGADGSSARVIIFK